MRERRMERRAEGVAGLALLLITVSAAWGAGAAPPPKTGSEVPANAALAAGSWTVARASGEPRTVAFTFTPCDPGGRFWLKVVNGAAGKPAVASAAIAVNGDTVFGPESFSARAGTLARPVAARAGENRIEVALRGQPGGEMELSVWAVQRCLRVELPPAPPGGYIPPDPVRWDHLVWIEGRVESASSWWAELCYCSSHLGPCAALAAAKIRPWHERTRAWRERGEDGRMGSYCGPDPPPVQHWEDLTGTTVNPGWWTAMALHDYSYYALRSGEDRFGYLLPHHLGDPPLAWDRYGLLVFNEAGDRRFVPLPIGTHPRLDPRYDPHTDGWSLFRERHDEATPPFFRVYPSFLCSGAHFEIDWEGDGTADLSMTCMEYDRLRPPGQLAVLFHDYTERGFHTSTIVFYRDAKPFKMGIEIVNFEPTETKRDYRGVPDAKGRVDWWSLE